MPKREQLKSTIELRLRGSFQAPSGLINVVETFVPPTYEATDAKNISAARTTIDLWAGTIAVRSQGETPNAIELADRMLKRPGFSVAYREDRDPLAFTDIKKSFLRNLYVLHQAGVTWSPHTLWPEKPDEGLPEKYMNAIGATTYCNVKDLSEDARIIVKGYPGDTRSPNKFFVDRAGFKLAEGPDWEWRGARLEAEAGAIVEALRQNFDFIPKEA